MHGTWLNISSISMEELSCRNIAFLHYIIIHVALLVHYRIRTLQTRRTDQGLWSWTPVIIWRATGTYTIVHM